jgi:digeranylgeranylglycerophospholipid reductase
MAARAAARSGASVLLVDRRRELGVPVQCGEALSEDPLKDLGIKPDPRWIAGRTNAVKIVSPSGIAVRISEKKIVVKFGGSSLADHERLLKAVTSVVNEARKGTEIVVVVSAMGKTTDVLMSTAKNNAGSRIGDHHLLDHIAGIFDAVGGGLE